MFEKLDRLRADVKCIEKRIKEERVKLKNAEMRLLKAEHEQILEDVSTLKYTPEQFNEFLKLASSGILGNPGAVIDAAGKAEETDRDDLYENDNENDEESEETLDED